MDGNEPIEPLRKSARRTALGSDRQPRLRAAGGGALMGVGT